MWGLRSDGAWSVYVLRCSDGTLYTGVTTDVARRLRMHERGRGARYTRGRGPFELVYTETRLARGAALRREAELKRLPRRAKLALAGPNLRRGSRAAPAP